MIISRIRFRNWRNFREGEAAMGNRVFLVGPNASGKSNFLDVFRFLRDIVKPGGGLQHAVEERGGVSKIRCLAARKDPKIEIEVHLSEERSSAPLWKYAISIRQEERGNRRPYLEYEKVWKGDSLIVERPYDEDKKDFERRTQTYLEQINANMGFREIARFFDSILYLHLVPQLVRYPKQFSGPGVPGDPFGRSFLERISKTTEKTRKARLQKIEKALRMAVPQLKELTYMVDTAEGGVPHLQARYDHWRPNAGLQREVDFSDGTLRLIGLFWTLLERDSVLLMEEPELSLNSEIVQRLPRLFHQLLSKQKRQIIVSTHSYHLLTDKGVGGEEVLLLVPDKEGTKIVEPASRPDIRALLESGCSVADAALPWTRPESLRGEQEELDLS